MAVKVGSRVAVAVEVAVAVAVGVAVGVGVGVGVEGCSSTEALACPALPLACPSLDGVTAFCSWKAWGCPSREGACGGYFAVSDVTVDGTRTYFYSASSGDYVATIADLGGADARCTNGASSFTPPASCAFTTVATCAPPQQDAGVHPYDAATDAADSGPAQPIPSGQPLRLPPR